MTLANPNRPDCDVAGHEWNQTYYGDTCVYCGLFIPDVKADDEEEWDSEPVGSCEWCDVNIYVDDYEGLCESCCWHAEQAEKGGH